MKEWKTPTPGVPLHPDSIHNQKKREKEAARAGRFSDPKYYLKMLAAWSAIAIFIGVFVVGAIVNAPTPEERAAIKAAEAETARIKAEVDRQVRQQESARADREARENRAVNVCEAAIRAGARVPRSVSFHTFGLDFSTRADGSILVAQDFDAINGYGQKTTNEGRCLVSAGGQLLEFYFNGNRMH